MANLMDLPNELLCQVIDYLQFERPLLRVLACMNHRLHDLSQPFLYRYTDDLSSHQQFALSRMLKETPDLKKAIWAYGPIAFQAHGYVSLFDFYDVEGLVNLKKLQLRVSNSLPVPVKSLQSISPSDIIGQLEEIELTASQAQSIDLSGVLHKFVLLLPSNIHTLTVTDLPTEFSSPSLRHHNPLSHRTWPGLRTFKLRGVENPAFDRWFQGNPMPGLIYRQLREILRAFPNLNTLHCTDMFLDLRVLRQPPELEITHNAVRLEALRFALKEVKPRLQELVLTIVGDTRTTLDGSPISLSAFMSLKILHISSVLIIERDVNMGMLHERLPPNLEALRLDHNPLVGYFGSPSGPVYESRGRLLQNHWKWLLLFPTYKTSHFPRLREVKIVEGRSISKHEVIKWELPVELAEQSEKADIDMTIWILQI